MSLKTAIKNYTDQKHPTHVLYCKSIITGFFVWLVQNSLHYNIDKLFSKTSIIALVLKTAIKDITIHGYYDSAGEDLENDSYFEFLGRIATYAEQEQRENYSFILDIPCKFNSKINEHPCPTCGRKQDL